MMHYLHRLNYVRQKIPLPILASTHMPISIIRNWYAVALYDAIKRMSPWKTSLYISPLILHTRKPEARITIRYDSDLVTLIGIFGRKMYFYKDVDIEENDKLILDVGAHIGLFSIFCALINNQAKVYAYEPFPENYSLLLHNLQLNKLSNRVKPRNHALSSKEGTIKLYLGDTNISHSTTFNHWKVKRNRFLSVRAVTLESVFRSEDLRRVDFMKVNCEGCEYDILSWLNANYLENITKLAVHCHNYDSKRNYKNIRKLLKQLGFKVHTRHGGGYKRAFLYAKCSK